MKKIQLCFLFLFLSAGAVFSQACVIDTTNYTLFAPPSEELPCVIRDSAYDISLQIFCPPAIGPATIDSILVTSFTGMPVGLTKVSNPSSGMVYPLTRMCINIQGTTQDTTGDYQVTYDGTAYTSQGNAPFWWLRQNVPGMLPEYFLSVRDAGQPCPNTQATGIKQNKVIANAFNVYPNPGNGVFNFELNTPFGAAGEINVRDLTGRLLYFHKTSPAFYYKTELDLSSYTRGIYLVEYRTVEGYSVKKVTIE